LGSLLLFSFFCNPVKRLQKCYDFDREYGFYRHKKTGKIICSNCLLKGIESPLTEGCRREGLTKITVLVCVNKTCRSTYRIPENYHE
jgi:hypothetical protein